MWWHVVAKPPETSHWHNIVQLAIRANEYKPTAGTGTLAELSAFFKCMEYEAEHATANRRALQVSIVSGMQDTFVTRAEAASVAPACHGMSPFSFAHDHICNKCNDPDSCVMAMAASGSTGGRRGS